VRYLLALFILLSTCTVAAQDSIKSLASDDAYIVPLTVDQDQMARFKKDRELNYDVVKSNPTIFDKIWDWFVRGVNKVLSWIFGNGPAGSIVAMLLKALPYVLLGTLLFLILRFFLKVNTQEIIGGKNTQNDIHLSTSDAILNKRDLAGLIDRAIADKNYRLAVRYYYLSVLQRLSDKELIDWHQDKTNEDYLRELTGTPLKEAMVHSTYLYDFVWYGNFNLNEQHFTKARKDFESLLTQLG